MWILFLSYFSFSSAAAVQKQLSLKEVSVLLYKRKLYFSALTYAIEHANSVSTLDPEFKKYLEELISKTGTELLSRTKNEVLKKLGVQSVYLLIAKKFFMNKQYDEAMKYLTIIPEKHRHYPEAQLTIGTMYMSQNKNDLALTAFKKCYDQAFSVQADKSDSKVQRYYSMIKDSCQMNIGRLAFDQGKYKESLKEFYKVTKQSYLWPYGLLEKAWANYHLGIYNRTLGLLATYNAPSLDTYFQPEVELLKALSYFKLCLWGDALKIIDRYTEVYKARSENIKNILKINIQSDDYFFRLILEHMQKKGNTDPFMKNLLTQIQKRTKFNLDLNAYLRAMKELEALRKSKRTAFVDNLIKNLEVDMAVLKSTVNFFVKKYFYDFINETNSLSYQMFNLKLNILTMQRGLEYKNEALVTDRSRGSSKVDKESDEMYWKFKQEFWADELGDYVFALESKCSVVKRETEKEATVNIEENSNKNDLKNTKTSKKRGKK